MTIHILTLSYAIYFNDSDEGNCYAGGGRRDIKAFTDPAKAKELADRFQSTVASAERENIVFPVQCHNQILKEAFGFTLHDIDDAGNFKLEVVPLELE